MNKKKLQEIEPFFVIGNPRSGTTLLRLMLNQHKEIIVPPECGFSVWLSDKFINSDFSSAEVKNDFVVQVLRSRKFETWEVDEQNLKDFVQQAEIYSYPDAVLTIYLFYAQNHERSPRLIGDKNNFYVNHLETIDKIFENPKYVFIVRDGRDVACSYLALQSTNSSSEYAPRLPRQIQDIAKEWTGNNNRIIRYLENFPRRSVLVKYEDLIKKPEDELRQVCAFFHIEYQPGMLEYYLDNDEPRGFLAWKRKVSMPPDPENFGMYKKILSAEEIKVFNEMAGGPLSYFKYL